jgi:hypothetical protein
MNKTLRTVAALRPRLITAELLSEALSRVTGGDDIVLKPGKNSTEGVAGPAGTNQ